MSHFIDSYTAICVFRFFRKLEILNSFSQYSYADFSLSQAIEGAYFVNELYRQAENAYALAPLPSKNGYCTPNI